MTTQTQAPPATAHQRNTQLALNALLGGVIAIGFVPIFVRLSQVGPSATAFWRMAIALPVFWGWMILEQRRQPTTRRPGSATDYRHLLLPGFLFAANLSIWHWSIRLTSVANSTLLANFAPIFVALGGWLIFGQRVNTRFVVGMCTAITGTILLVGSSFGLSGGHLLGDALGLLAAVFYASYILSIKYLRADFSTATIMAWSALASCIVLLPVALLSGETLLPPSTAGWLVLLGLALISHVGGQSLITFSLAQLPAAFSSVVLLFQPIEATFWADLILGEPVGLIQAFGGALALIGIFIARRATQY
jgi:drug/metabolite transporter (DMT)-like permease